MSDETDPVELAEPREARSPNLFRERRDIWMRGLWMLLFAFFFGLAETLLLVIAVVQFFWMLLAGERNGQIAELGRGLALWLADVARFQSGASDARPFPCAKWGIEAEKAGEG